MPEQAPGAARVFGEDQVDGTEDAPRTWRQITKGSDGVQDDYDPEGFRC